MCRMKRLLAAALAVLLLLTGCSKANVNPGAQVTVPVETEPKPYPAGRSDIRCELLPRKVESAADVTVLKWVCLGATSTLDRMVSQIFSYHTDWSEQAVQELNQTLEEQGLSYRIQFVMFTTTSVDEINWFRVPEVLEAIEDADLITGPFTRKQMQNDLLPLTQYIPENAEHSLANGVLHETNWVDATVAGEIYGIPTALRYVVGSGWNIRSEELKALGISPEEFRKEYWDMDEVFREIYTRNGAEAFLLKPESGITRQNINGVSALQPSAISFMLDNRYMSIGSCFGVDFSGEKPVVVNYLRTDYVRSIQQAMLRYHRAGYFRSESMGMQLLDYSNAFSDEIYTYTYGAGAYAEEIICVPLGGLHYVQPSATRLTGIPRDSKNARSALELLSRMGEDEAFRNRLLLGEEGVDYTMEAGAYQPLERVDGSYAMNFLSPLNALVASAPFDAELTFPEKEGMNRTESYQQVMEAAQLWPALSFDFSTLVQEERAVRAVLETYLSDFASMTAETYEQMLQEINRAGEEYIQAELQRQLDEWWKTQQN